MSPWTDYDLADKGHYQPDRQGPPPKTTPWYLSPTRVPQHWPEPPQEPIAAKVEEHNNWYPDPMPNNYATECLTLHFTDLLSKMGEDRNTKQRFLRHLKLHWHTDNVQFTENHELISSYKEISQWANMMYDIV